MVKSIFIVDDHPVIRAGYRYLLKNEPDLKVCGEAGTASEAMQRIPGLHPDLVLVDISLGGANGITLLKDLHALDPSILTLVVSTYDESVYGERALLAGARGYVMKSEVDGVIVAAIRRVLSGGYYLSDEMNTKIIHHFQGIHDAAPHHHDPSLPQLTDRELEVFELIGKGYRTREIGDALHISPKTVESHRCRIKEKLDLDSTNELIQRAAVWVTSPAAQERTERNGHAVA